MQTATEHSADTRRAALEPQFPPLELENRPMVDTFAAAYYLSRKPQAASRKPCALGPVWRIFPMDCGPCESGGD